MLLAVNVGVKVALPLSDHVAHVAAEAEQAVDLLGREDDERLAAFVEDAFVEPKVFEASPEVETALGGLGEILKRVQRIEYRLRDYDEIRIGISAARII